jgi:hypothetical protein
MEHEFDSRRRYKSAENEEVLIIPSHLFFCRHFPNSPQKAVNLKTHHIAELTCVVLAEFYQSLLCFNVNHGRNPFFLFVWRPSSAVTNVPFAKVTWILHFSLFTSCRLLVLSMFAKRTHAIAEKLRIGGAVGVVAEVCVAVIVKLNVNVNIGS